MYDFVVEYRDGNYCVGYYLYDKFTLVYEFNVEYFAIEVCNILNIDKKFDEEN